MLHTATSPHSDKGMGGDSHRTGPSHAQDSGVIWGGGGGALRRSGRLPPLADTATKGPFRFLT